MWLKCSLPQYQSYAYKHLPPKPLLSSPPCLPIAPPSDPLQLSHFFPLNPNYFSPSPAQSFYPLLLLTSSWSCRYPPHFYHFFYNISWSPNESHFISVSRSYHFWQAAPEPLCCIPSSKPFLPHFPGWPFMIEQHWITDWPNCSPFLAQFWPWIITSVMILSSWGEPERATHWLTTVCHWALSDAQDKFHISQQPGQLCQCGYICMN